ncbi:MAG: dTDP-4-dehydrorhamnose 3,5-epimerase [Pseudomonadota bacterium]|uniref:dTDP-4-dehydrorhamnose 3,5-epimerase n=1 Tax=Sphingobium sp. TaxID=1912891 RepID=UPI002E21ECF3
MDSAPSCPTNPTLVPATRHRDARGWFAESWSIDAYARIGIGCAFVQDNHSLSRAAFTLRGLHYQRPPHTQAKLVRCLRGRIFDVAVDLRAGSPGFGRWTGVELSAEGGAAFFVPIGFAHGFLTLEPDCEVFYKVSAPYAPASDAGLLWDDPAIGIDWPLPRGVAPVLSAKDAALPRLADIAQPFPSQEGTD